MVARIHHCERRRSAAISMRPVIARRYDEAICLFGKIASPILHRGRLCLAMMLLIFSCAPKRTITGTDRILRDSTIIREIPVLVEVPGATVVTPSVNIRQLDSLLRAGVPAQVITERLIREDPETRLKVGILIDQMGNLTAVCEQQERMIEILNREVEYYRELYEQATVTVEMRWYQQLWHDFKLLIVGAALLLAFSFVKKLTA